MLGKDDNAKNFIPKVLLQKCKMILISKFLLACFNYMPYHHISIDKMYNDKSKPTAAIISKKNSNYMAKELSDFLDLSSEVSPKSNYKDIPTNLPEDQVENIEIIGIGKLKSEVQSIKKIKGSKVLIKNHHFNELGEGEPSFDEKLIQ